jgi:hypothetical protein
VTPKEAIAILDGTTKVKSAEDFLAMLMALTKQGKVRAIILTEEESAAIASLLRSQQAEAGAVFDAYIKHQGDIGHGYYCTIDNKGTPCNCGAWELTAAIERLADNNGVSPLLARLEAAEEVARTAEAHRKEQHRMGDILVRKSVGDEDAYEEEAECRAKIVATGATLDAALAKWEATK